MFLKSVGFLLILLGIAGTLLPVIPGLLLITIGSLLFFKDRLAQIRKMLPEEIPAPFAILYSLFLPRILKPHYEIIAGEMSLSQGQMLLDVGTGPGVLPIEIAKRFPSSKVIGIDLSEKMVEIAVKNKLRYAQDARLDNLEFKVMDAKSLGFPDESFSLVVSAGSLHHWKEPVRVFDEIYRVLKTGAEAWIYDGYAGASASSLVRHILNIHGYTEEEYGTIVADSVSKSKFKSCSFDNRGIMKRLKFKKGIYFP